MYIKETQIADIIFNKDESVTINIKNKNFKDAFSAISCFDKIKQLLVLESSKFNKQIKKSKFRHNLKKIDDNIIIFNNEKKTCST